jgi:hypothetical protein
MSNHSNTRWKTPVLGVDYEPKNKASSVVLDLSSATSGSAHIVEIPQLRTQLHELSIHSDAAVVVSVHLAGNNLRLRRGGEQLATMLVSMFHRLAFHSQVDACPHDAPLAGPAPSPKHVVQLEELDISSTGAFEDIAAWTKVFQTITELPNSPLQRICANDEAMQVAVYSPLLESMAASFVHLTHVSLRRCLLSTAAMEAFARGIKNCQGGSSLEFLDVSENELNSAALIALATALHDSEAHRSRIRVLNISHNTVCTSSSPSDSYCRKGLLSLALLALHAPSLCEVSLKCNRLGAAYPPRWPSGGDHGGVSELCEAARRSIATRGGRKPPVIDVSDNDFNPATLESLHRCSGFTAVVM